MTCPLCENDAPLSDFAVSGGPDDATVAICATCAEQIKGAPESDHWRALANTMWTPEPAVQVLVWRMLDRLKGESWAADLLDQLWLDDETRAWAEADAGAAQSDVIHRDSNGAVLEQGDTVTLVKDLAVKGAGFTAKRGTAVRGIALVPDNAEQIEGRVEGQRIVILTEFVKKR